MNIFNRIFGNKSDYNPFPKVIVAWHIKQAHPMTATILENGTWGDISGSELANQEELRMLTPKEIATLVTRGEYDFFTFTKNIFTAPVGDSPL